MSIELWWQHLWRASSWKWWYMPVEQAWATWGHIAKMEIEIKHTEISTWTLETEAGGSGLQGHPLLVIKFRASLSYRTLFLNLQKKRLYQEIAKFLSIFGKLCLINSQEIQRKAIGSATRWRCYHQEVPSLVLFLHFKEMDLPVPIGAVFSVEGDPRRWA